jgi:hypothetical protein
MALSFHQYDTGVSVSRQINVHIPDDIEVAENVAVDHIRTHHIYQNSGGHNLFCFSVEESDLCKDYDDPYGVRVTMGGCYVVRCKFEADVPEVTGFTAEALVFRNRLREISFDEKPLSILTEQDCIDMGYEVLYPDLEGGPVQCDTEKGIVNLSSGCKDMCGDGICQEAVCMAEGCPCAEDKERCSSDCS